MKRYMILLLLFSSSIIFGMQQLQKSAGLFDTLSKDISYPFFGRLNPREKNELRKTCKTLSVLLSFYNPSDIILHKDFYATKKDICSIFVVATFDNNFSFVEKLCKRYGPNNHNYSCIESKCQFFEINSKKFKCLDRKTELVVNPYSIACKNNNTAMKNLLEKYVLQPNIPLSDAVKPDGRFSKAHILLIACISRNTERITQATQDIMLVPRSDIGYSLAVIIDNDDAQSLAAIMHQEKIKEYIKDNGADLLNLAIFGQHKKVTEILIKSKCFDFNAHPYIVLDEENIFFDGTYVDLLNCCNDHSKIDGSVFDLLRENGAETSDVPIIDFQAITSPIKKAWDDFVWSHLLKQDNG